MVDSTRDVEMVVVSCFVGGRLVVIELNVSGSLLFGLGGLTGVGKSSSVEELNVGAVLIDGSLLSTDLSAMASPLIALDSTLYGCIAVERVKIDYATLNLGRIKRLKECICYV